MARRKIEGFATFNVKMRLRGDGQENPDGQPTDGGYADKSFFVESRLEGKIMQPWQVQRMMAKEIAKVVLAEIKKDARNKRMIKK